MNMRFRVSTRQTGRRRDVQVVVYDELADLQRAAFNYGTGALFGDALAVSQPRETLRVGADGTETLFRGAGTIRLWRGDMGAAILAHEMTHMALAIYRQDMKRAPLGNMKNEETLCHIVSDLVRAANRKLWKLGVYP